MPAFDNVQIYRLISQYKPCHSARPFTSRRLTTYTRACRSATIAPEGTYGAHPCMPTYQTKNYELVHTQPYSLAIEQRKTGVIPWSLRNDLKNSLHSFSYYYYHITANQLIIRTQPLCKHYQIIDIRVRVYFSPFYYVSFCTERMT